MYPTKLPSATAISANVSAALAEDVGTGDITAELVSAAEQYSVAVITREEAVICGRAWVDETFAQVDSEVQLEWLVEDGQRVKADAQLFRASGSARSILTAERSALNFLQLLSGVATTAADYAEAVAGTALKVLDTRKTIPGLRLAQKYAVACGGCHNHRIGLYDAFLIKENHIAACGSISEAIGRARQLYPERQLEIEVESLAEFRQALAAGPDIIMLDELSLDEMRQAVTEARGQCQLEASGNMTREKLAEIATTGVDFVSIGALTKHVRAIDLSMRYI